ncbi:hypothetical protein ABT301_29140 [Streptomyces sp. NPDC000987]|uniref:hypothetical protein n=1 Tax=Streptomyces sp. NPDC000987 TaxID=3154374 RepID=UPI003320FEC0
MAAAPHSAAIARILRGLGLTQGKGCDFRVTGDYRNGERIGTFVVVLTRHADEVIAEHADEIERLSAESGWPFRVSVRYHKGERPMTTVANYGSRVREEPAARAEVLEDPAPAGEPAPEAVDEPDTGETPQRPAIDPATLARLWAEDRRAPICSPLRDMIRTDDCDDGLNPTAAGFERIAAELNALPADPAALARLWAEDLQSPVCAPLCDMIRGDECDDDGYPTMAAWERVAAEVQALARSAPAGEPAPQAVDEDDPGEVLALEAAPGTAPAPATRAEDRLQRDQAEALGWSTGQADLVAAAAAGQLYRDFGAVLRVVPVPGHPGYVTSMHRLRPLVDAGFLAVGEPDATGRRAVRVTADGRLALTVWKRWRPQPQEKSHNQECEALRPLLGGAQARRLAARAREEEQRRRRERGEFWEAVQRLHAWEAREDRLWAAWAKVNGIRFRFSRRPAGWVPTAEEIAEHGLDPEVVAELREDAERPQPKPELPRGKAPEREELPPLEADDQTPEQLSLLFL